MAYLLTAIMTGCVAAMISIFTGGGFMQVLWNYILFGPVSYTHLTLPTNREV